MYYYVQHLKHSSSSSGRKDFIMANKLKPGENSGNDGGIYQEVGPRGGRKGNYTTIPDDRTAPPTTKSGNSWDQVDRTPDSKRK